MENQGENEGNQGRNVENQGGNAGNGGKNVGNQGGNVGIREILCENLRVYCFG